MGFNLLGRFNSWCGGHDHEHTVCKDSSNDCYREYGVDQYIYGHPTDRIEGIKCPKAVGGTEPEDIFSFANYYKSLQKHKYKIYKINKIIAMVKMETKRI